jgi:hypothetical protein
MLTFYKLVPIAALFALFVAIIGIAYYSSPPAHGPAKQQAATEKEAAEKEQNQGVRPSVWGFLFPDSISIFTLCLVIATLVLGVGAVLQIGFLDRAEQIAAKSADAAKQSADAANEAVTVAKNNAVRELRAYMSLNITARPYPPSAPNRWAISFVVTNGGRTLARNVQIRQAIVTQGLTDTRDPWDVAGMAVMAAPPNVFGPNETQGYQFRDVEFSEVPEIAERTFRRSYVAWITYQDVISSPPRVWQTQISRVINGDAEGAVSFGQNPTHNCADDDCP